MMKINKYTIFPKLLCIILLLSITCCAPVISKQVREQARRDLTFKEVVSDPERYKGELIILSGIIIEAKNTKEGTLFEVLQTPADYRGEPEDFDKSQGRFLALNEGYLDPSVYTKGREVTIAGRIEGKRVQAFGKIEYTYPFISIKEIYLWPIHEYYPYPYSYYAYDRYYWWRGSLLHHRFRHFPRKRLDKGKLDKTDKQQIGIGKSDKPKTFKQRSGKPAKK